MGFFSRYSLSSGSFLFYLLMGSGPLVSVSSSNWLICWVGIELSFLGLIPLLISDSKGVPTLSSESSMKYFCIQAAGSGVLMFGGIMKFMMPVFSGGHLPGVFFLMGLMLKLGIFPFHFWVPGVVAGIGWYSIFLILTWQKLAPFMFLMNLVEGSSLLSSTAFYVGGLSSVVGGIIGLNQTKMSPMLGASSITHSGWVVVGIVCGSFWIYLGIYIASLVLLLLALWKEEYFLSGLMVISLSGLPPFLMFVGKWSVLKSALAVGGSWWFLFLPLVGSIMSLFFYLKFFYSLYLEEEGSLNLKLSLVSCFCILNLLGGFLVLSF